MNETPIAAESNAPVNRMEQFTFSIGPSDSGQWNILRYYGCNFPAIPSAVLCQVRNSPNDPNTGYTDAFAVRVIEANQNSLKVRITRVEAQGPWGMDLKLCVLAVW